MQCALFQWARLQKDHRLALLEGSMNGVHLTKAQAGKAKAAGELKGAPDVRLPWPTVMPHRRGLVIELKVGYNVPSDEQVMVLSTYVMIGWSAWVVWDDWTVATSIIERYLEGTVETFSHKLARRVGADALHPAPSRRGA